MQASLYRDPPFLQKRLRRYEVKGCVFYTVVVEKGRFLMGDDDSEYDDEKPAHSVDIQYDYELGVQPVTQALWRAVMGSDPEALYFAGDERPVEGVNCNDICGSGGFLEKLNALLQQDVQGAPFCLPNETQWEYAAYGGRYDRQLGLQYTGSSRLDEVGWNCENSSGETHAVGQKMPNVLSLFDMSGNVWELVENSKFRINTHNKFRVNAINRAYDKILSYPQKNYPCVRCGGGWGNDPDLCMVSGRFIGGLKTRRHDSGFRLARSFVPFD